MAGTDRTRRAGAETGGPAIILVDPQLGENIGMAARAMLNCGLTDLRLVRPRDGWPNKRAVAAASGADLVLDAARLFEHTEDAVADLSLVFAATTRDRSMIKQIFPPEEAVREMHMAGAGTSGVSGVIFGGEAMGLDNDDIALADHVIAVPLNPGFSSLNLSQAVLLIAYEWRKSVSDAPPAELRQTGTQPANKAELMGLFEHLESELDASGFFHIREKRPIMARNLRNLLQRAQLTEKEVRTLRGVISSLSAHKPED
ncbi:MAG: RNA methyltransferase [Rhodospirillales bacterium]|jgi:tRNA/rRNA methyltransferase|nr:RNA methyltransferase [Rhodospirillales bacterium]MDP6645977.1 RNA methyltransferase [Rhodospirillales bacterium]MDP6842897.1 RNA methyltransferase [Rhodospirillales bacterium]